MNHSLNSSEQEALLGTKNTQGSRFERPYYSGERILDQSSASSDLDINSNTGVIKTWSVEIQRLDKKPGLPIWRAALLVVNSTLGAGILNLPEAYANCGGITTAFAIQMGFLVFITGAFLIQAHCVDKHGSQNFQEIVRELLGPGAYIATQLIIVLYMFICTVAYMIVIGDQLEKVGEAIDPQYHWYLSREFLMCAVCILCFLPLCLPKSLKVLSYSSVLGTVGVFFVCMVTCVKYLEGKHTVSKEPIQVKLPWTDAFAAIPTIVLSYMCHVPSVAVYVELKRPSVPRFGIVTVIAMAICCTANTLVASFGYLTFGTTVKSDVLLNYDSNDVLVNIVRAMISVIVLTTGATVVFCGRSCLEGLYRLAFRMLPSLAQQNESRRRIVQTLVWFTASLTIAVYVKDIQSAIDLCGGLAALFIFFYPGIFLIQEMLQYPVLTTTRKLLIILGLWYAVVGMFVFAESEVLAITKEIRA